MKELLKKYMLLQGPSGYESKIAYELMSDLNQYSEHSEIDNIGNVIARINGNGENKKKIMILAHMDQIGFIVKNIDENGYLKLERLGGVPEKVLPGLEISIRNINDEYMAGVIGIKSHHATTPDEKYQVSKIDSIYVDIGADSAHEVRAKGIEIGCPAVYAPKYIEFEGNKVCGTSLDNRGGCACLVEIARHLSARKQPLDVFLVGTVWEEFNLRGAIIAARKIKPDIIICLDITLCGDTPDLKNIFNTKLGGGPVISMYSFHGRGTLNGMIAHEGLSKLAISLCDEENLKAQYFAAAGLLTDASYLQLENEGAAVLDLSFPVRYTHSPIEICDVSDLESLSKLVCRMVESLDDRFDVKRF